MNIDNLSLAQVMEEEIELIPLMSKDEESKLNKQDISSVLPILSLRNTVLFPVWLRQLPRVEINLYNF